MAMTKVKNLQIWCKKMADGYRDVEVRDMAASWKSGLVFCAIIHRFRPDLIDYDSLSKENVFENNNLAFEVAEKQLNIPAFLEAADMVAIRVPDRLSVVTYVSQYYNYFHDKQQLGGPGVNKFNKSAKPKDNVTQPVNKSLTPAKVNVGNAPMKTERQESIGDKCTICHERVYLLERHIENSKLYHRSCFRKSDLSPTSKVFKRQPYNSRAEDKNDIQTTKHRKIDTDTPKKEPQEAGLDFWQRRAQQKANQTDKNKTTATPVQKTETKTEPKANESATANDVPFWKRGLGKEDKLSNTGADKNKPKVTTGLADKFKELDQRNLKSLNSSEMVGNTEKSKERDKQFGHTKKTFEKTVDDKPTVNIALTPVPKPRQNVLNKVEKMETDNTESHEPKPVPRYQKKSETQSPRAAPRNTEQKSKSPTVTKKHDFTRPKTPPQKHKTEFSLNLTKNGSKSAGVHNAESPSSPPALPVSSPPRLPKSQPPNLPTSKQSKSSMDISPVSTPRTTNRSASADTKDKHAMKSNLGPAKPPRSAVIEEKTRSPSPVHKNKTSKVIDEGRSNSPMDTSEMHVAPKAAIKGPKTEYTASVVVPNRSQDEKKDKQVFGGLLKSLADVRQKHDVDSDNNAKHNGAISDKENKSKLKINGAVHDDGHELSHKFNKFNKPEKDDLSKNRSVPQRPKSSFVSQSSSLFDSEEKKEPNVKVNVTKKTTTTTVVTSNKTDKPKIEETKTVTTVTKVEDDIPEWKKQLEQRKKDRARPKSADILSEKSDVGNIPSWQIEAEKRKEARKGAYVDPEKVKIGINRNNAALDRSPPQSPPRRKAGDVSDKFVSPGAEEKVELPQRHKIEYRGDKCNENEKPVEGNKKKITVDHKFKFEDIEVKPGPRKPPRPGVQPSSPTFPTSPKPGPARPPPPKTGGFQAGKHHITAYQIQKQLQLIDTKLTHLELKGRTLEDSIRNAEDEEEDDLMIAWFQLVNEKNDLVRTECDFIYISREQELELEQQQIDQKLRDLVDKPNKSKDEIKEEEYWMEKLVNVVNQRSKIVDSIDEDRIRYLEEDSHIEAMLQQKGFLKDNKDGGIKKEKKNRRLQGHVELQ